MYKLSNRRYWNIMHRKTKRKLPCSDWFHLSIAKDNYFKIWKWKGDILKNFFSRINIRERVFSLDWWITHYSYQIYKITDLLIHSNKRYFSQSTNFFFSNMFHFPQGKRLENLHISGIHSKTYIYFTENIYSGSQ